MKIRAIYLSGNARIKQLAAKYCLPLNPIQVGQFIFELSALSVSGQKLLEKTSLQHPPVFELYCSSQADLVFLRIKTVTTDTAQGFDELINSLENQSSNELTILAGFFKKSRIFFRDRQHAHWTVGRHALDFRQRPLIMGILNVTPDSFSDGGRYADAQKAVNRALEMEAAGARIVDIGGESTRPGSETVPAEIEIERVLPVIKELRRRSNVLISIDTTKSAVARAAMEQGANIINDISGALFDPAIVEVAKDFDCPLIIMHIKGRPKDMQQDPFYEDVQAEVYRYFEERIAFLEKCGVHKIILDPGIGFGKRQQDNLELIRDLKDFTFLGKPLLMGTSRKSFIGRLLDNQVDQRLSGSLAAQVVSCLNGADIVRVHDVKETSDALKVAEAIS